MNVILLCNTDKPEVERVADLISSYGHQVHITDESPSVDALKNFDLGVSWMYRRILKPEQIKAVRLGILNNHSSLLPWGRGADPSVWSIAYGEPAGVTLHWIDDGIDTGPIIAQHEIYKGAIDTWQDLYIRLTDAMFALFKDTWPMLEAVDFKTSGTPQVQDVFPARRSIDVNNIDNLERVFGKGVAHKFVDILRARTFPGKPSAYIYDEHGKKIYVRVTLERE